MRRRSSGIGRCILGLAMLAAVSTGCGQPSASFDQIMREGVHEYDAGEYADAVAMFRNAAEADHERPEPAYYTGLCYMRMADKQFKEDDIVGALRYCDRATSTLDAAVDAFPGYSKAVQAKADAYKLKGKQEAARDVADWAARYVGPQAKMHILKAREYAQAGEIDRAELFFNQAVTMEPKNPAAYAELGLFYMRCGNDSKAMVNLRKAQELRPGSPGVIAAIAKLGAASADAESP